MMLKQSGGHKGHQKTPPMTAFERAQRDAEVASVMRFLSKPTTGVEADVESPRFVKANERNLKRATNRGLAAEAWKAAKEEAKAAEKAAKATASKAKAAAAKEAAVAAAELQVKSSLALLMAGHRLTAAAVVRGDWDKLQMRYGPAAATIGRAMKAFLRKQIALKLVEERRAELQAAKIAEAAKKAKLAAKKAAVGLALKAAMEKERSLVLEQLCNEADLNACPVS